jgi:formate/nitrite transporter FocA (FNT family)
MNETSPRPPASDDSTASNTDAAGENSPFLDEKEQRQASERAPIGPLVIHEIIREQGITELDRSFSGLSLSAFAAGLSIGFSFLTQAYLQSGMPDAPWRRLVAAFGYTLGFLIVILGQQQLFTETTLTALIPALTQRDLKTLARTLRVWAIVLVANLLGTLLFASALAMWHVIPPETVAAMNELAMRVLREPPMQVGLTAIAAGWLIGLTVWLLPGAGTSRPLIIILLTYTIAVCQFPHVIAGSVESAYAVLTGQAGIGAYFLHFLIPTLIGNTIGGTALVALLNHAPIAEELAGRGMGR